MFFLGNTSCPHHPCGFCFTLPVLSITRAILCSMLFVSKRFAFYKNRLSLMNNSNSYMAATPTPLFRDFHFNKLDLAVALTRFAFNSYRTISTLSSYMWVVWIMFEVKTGSTTLRTICGYDLIWHYVHPIVLSV